MKIPQGRKLMAKLREMGFEKDYDTTAGGGRTVQFSRTYRKRRGDPWRRHVEVQLCDTGKHRTSHFLGGCMNTYPTAFYGVPDMLLAIESELTRTDHPTHAVTEYRHWPPRRSARRAFPAQIHPVEPKA